MIDRRGLLFGGACIAALGSAEALRPRTHVSLLGSKKLGDIVPKSFAQWSAEDGGDIIVPTSEGSLASRLYSDIVTRTYQHSSGRGAIMLLIAYGAAQSDVLQLHRPESCYPAIGLNISARAFTNIPLPAARPIPGVELTAGGGDRIEDIVYWTRLGEYLPQTAGEQRTDRLRASLKGLVCDGALIRASILRQDKQPDYATLSQFLIDMVLSMKPADRMALIGTDRARLIDAA
ncbi:EpsI family protein [Sphingobium sufflavum]|uniref:exosortase-associated protein EpsI, V-type n=1 Tax=Sphingobium sufflavum TaxID=1129547 RepID=UPI001F3D5845|nr:exosortase-associated protein EpsI, V-type [Sphingobium sufflavum]MCE7798524.1 EpsI family protein [Sphingobium sufflavum]